MLIPDFKGSRESLKTVLDASPEILAHNIETVPTLYKTVRPGANYRQSVELLRRSREMAPETFTKTGIMVGLGETQEQIAHVMEELVVDAGVDIFTIGQYLQPTKEHHPVIRFYHPDEFRRNGPGRKGDRIPPRGVGSSGEKFLPRRRTQRYLE